MKKQRSIPRIEGNAEGLNRKMEPVSGKWYTEEEPDNEEHQAMQGKIDNSPEHENSECSGTSGVLNTLEVQDTEPKCDCENILDIVKRNHQKDREDSL